MTKSIDMETLKTKAQKVCSKAIIEATKTNDLIYAAKLDNVAFKVYEALESKDLHKIIEATNELEALIKPERHYGELVEGTKSTRKINKH